MKEQWQLYILTVIITLWLTACGSSPLVRPEAEVSARQTETTPTVVAEITKEVVETSPFVSPIQPTATLQATPHPSSTPTLTPAPTATAIPPPLPPLDKNLQTIIFTTNSAQGPEIWRVQVDKTGQKAGPVAQIVFPTDPKIRILGVFPSPDGQRVAIGWVFDTGATYVYVADVSKGQLIPLFGDAKIDQRVTFLDWTPDSQSVLVLGGTLNPDLGNSAWLVNVNTHDYQNINIKQVNEIPIITSASFSPDGKMIAYAQTNCYQCGSEIWRIALDGSDQQLLFEDSKTRVEDVMWSPDGNYIAFNQWLESNEVAEGELYLMKTDGSGSQLVSSLLTGYYDLFQPAWSPNNQQITFVKSNDSKVGEGLDQLYTNLYIVDIFTNQVSQLTNFENTQLIKPIWSRDGSQIAFLMNDNLSANQFKSQTIVVNERSLKELGVDEALLEIKSSKPEAQSVGLDPQSFIVWLPEPF